MTAPTPATQTTLADWLLERLAITEREAQYVLANVDSLTTYGSVKTAIRHVAEDTLADVAAKRAVVALHSGGGQVFCPSCDDNIIGWAARIPCPTLRHLAAVYSDHPDYDERWAVS